MSMYDLDVVSDVVPDVVPHLNGLPSKQFKARIRCGGAANYGPRITEYIAEYYGVFNTAQLHFGHICHQVVNGHLWSVFAKRKKIWLTSDQPGPAFEST